MSILNSDPWFGRGATLFSGPAKYAGMGGTLASVDPTNGTAVTGSQKVFTDTDPRTNSGGVLLSNRPVTCIAVRNTSGAALLPGAVVKFKASAILDEVDGAAATATGLIGVVDEYLPAAGVANNDIFWLVVSGPTAITTSASLVAGAAITATAGKAAAADPAKPAEVIGNAIKAPASGMVRAIIGIQNGHSAV
jgi:hypothetical protein